MTEFRNRLPIGQQDFKTLRLNGSVYVDKTQFIKKIVDSDSQYYFLARPRRFGKSLFLSSLRYFFEGRRDLFKDLYIDSTDRDWTSHPVLYLDLNSGEYTDPAKFDSVIDKNLRRWEERYDIAVVDDTHVQRFHTIIEKAHERTGRQVVVLVDEYDKPLVRNFNNDDEFEVYRKKLAAFYSSFKTCAEHIRLVFLTGVSRFSKLSIFSDLNNLNDITFADDFADICGITEKELYDNFKSGIASLAEEYDTGYDDICRQLKRNYDGYRFATKGSDIYNPWSVLNCFAKRSISNYWNETGMPTIVAESLHRVDADIEAVLTTECSRRRLLGLDLKSSDPLALLYQTGYLTIKDYDRKYETYTLGVPNQEVKEGLFDVLLPYYVRVRRGDVSDIMFRLVKDVRTGKAEDFMKCLQEYFAGISYKLKMDNENNFQNAFYILMTMLNFTVQAEAETSDGRIDLLLKAQDYIYVIELKYDGTAREALDQINGKQYALQFRADLRKLIKIGVSFSSKTRRIEDWIIE